jgi:two-component system, cell cycle sensor histidine kinase DivJ
MEGKTESAAHRDRYLAHLAHELRTPLNAVIGYADAMRARPFGPLDERYAEYAQIIGDAGRHMLALAEDLLARARIDTPAGAPTVERFDAAEPMAQALQLMTLEATAAGVGLRFASPGLSLEIIADRRALVQVVVNLLANAIRHTPAGGVVTLTLEESKEGLAELTVSDTGTGLAPGSETAGMGRGLVRELVEARGGTMALAGAPGGGTVVAIRLPRPESAP